MPKPPVPKESDYKIGFEKATSSLSEVQNLINDRKWTEARAKARSLVLEIQKCSGIEPKTPEPIGATTALDKDDLKTAYDSLSTYKRFALARIVKKLKERDIAYLKKELLEIHSIPLFFSVYGSSNHYLAYDSDVVDATLQYEFNRELLDLVQEVKELKWTEADFENALEANRMGALKNNWDNIKIPKPVYRVPVFNRDEFKASGGISKLNDTTVAIQFPTYKGLPIAVSSLNGQLDPQGVEGSGDLYTRNTGYLALGEGRVSFGIWICHSLGYASVGVDPDGKTFETSSSEQNPVIKLDSKGHQTYVTTLGKYKDYVHQLDDTSHPVTEKAIAKLYCSIE